jgi:hypothetical protein
MTHTERIKVTPALQLYAPGVVPVQILAVEVALDREEGQISEVLLSFTVSASDWQRIDVGAWFHLTPEGRGPVFAGRLQADQPVELEVRLEAGARAALLVGTVDIFDVGAKIRGGEVEQAWMQTEAWRALYVKQPRGGIKTGFATAWA